MSTRNTYHTKQEVHNTIEEDDFGRKRVIRKVVYEQGEMVEGYEDVRMPLRFKFRNGGFLTIFQEALVQIAVYGKLGKLELTLLLYLLGTANQDGSLVTDLEKLSEALGYNKSSISKALKGLVQRNIVIRRDGNRYDRTPLQLKLSLNYDQLNYNFAYNGKTASYSRKKELHPALSAPGDQPDEWIDMGTGVVSLEKGGRELKVLYDPMEEKTRKMEEIGALDKDE